MPRFENRPIVRKSKLNVLPSHGEEREGSGAVGLGRFPPWLHRKMPTGNTLWETQKVLAGKRLPTVCEEAKCPNLLECWSQKTATFLVMGKACTRACGFCDIDFTKQPLKVALDEPERVAQSVSELGLKHVVITMVARDDLSDGGAAHLAAIIQEVRLHNPGVAVEVLTSDFEGKEASLDLVIAVSPTIFNHNIETVRSLTPRVRNKATYARTLHVLSYVHKNAPQIPVKSGLMVGLGESEEEVKETIRDLKEAGCSILTIGQYLQPNRQKLRVKAFVHPDQFEAYAAYGRSIGVKHMFCGPFVRSSYHASSVFKEATDHE